MTHHNIHEDSLNTERLAVGLGLFSIGLGLAETLAPGAVARLIGVPPTGRTRATLQAMGARETANGLAILAQPDRAGWLWARVGGDAVDLALLGGTLGSERTDRQRAAAAVCAVLGAAALDAYCAVRIGRAPSSSSRRQARVHIEHAATVNKPIGEVYAFWRDFQNFPRFMRHVEAVEVLGDRRSRWRVAAPAGMHVEWDAEITDDRPGERLAWRSLEGSDVEHRGHVTFAHAPGARGTEVRVSLEYAPPAGTVGRNVARLFGREPEQQIREDLRRFKQLVETGEIALSDGPGLWRPAQPAPQAEDLTRAAGVHR
jgi:uncharacterized membrane protein